MKELVTVDTICTRYGCERHKAASIIRNLPYFRVGKTLMAYAGDLEEWERGQMVVPIRKGVRTATKTPWAIPRRKAE